MKKYIGVDLGTSSLKASVSDGDKILATVSAGYEVYYPAPNYSEQKPDDWYRALVYVLMELDAKVGISDVSAISFSGQMHGLVVLDEKDEVIRPAILWNDNRTQEECAYLNNIVGKDKLVSLTGNIAFTGFTAPKILWLSKNEPVSFKRIKKIMLPKDYLAYKMSGVFATDVSDASGTLLFDVKNRKWSSQLLDICGISEAQLPKVYESYEVVGCVRSDFADLVGLSKTTKVVIGGGDQAVGAIGTGTIREGELSVSLGTSGVIFAPSDKYNEIPSGASHSFCHANGKYHTMAVMLSAAGSLDWWIKDALKTDFSALDDCDKENIDKLYFLPYLSGERSPINDPNASGAFFGLKASTTQKAMTRAVIEGICLGLKDCYLSLGIKAEKIRAVGGGAKSKLFLKTLADCLGVTVCTIDTTEGGIGGAIALARVSDGVSLEDSARSVKETAFFAPDPSRESYYTEKYNNFKRFYKATCFLY